MFLFFHSSQDEKNRNYYKGLLFEKLLAKHLDRLGYSIEIRKKHNSLEYDLEGKDRATNLKIIGEAKAHNSPISGEDFSSFVGKLLPLGLLTKDLHGLFMSISSLTSEAEDYYSKVKHLGLVAYTGRGLHDAICHSLELPSLAILAHKLKAEQFEAQTSSILTTDTGNYVCVIAALRQSSTPSHFAVFGCDAQTLTDDRFLSKIAESVSELQSLQPLTAPEVKSKVYCRHIPSGLTVGTDWTDYRLPASPDHFVGRKEFRDILVKHISEEQRPNIIQIKSRSGVGKSSALAVLRKDLAALGFMTELHDARDVKSVLDVFYLIRRFTHSEHTPSDFREVNIQLNNLRDQTTTKAIFMVDQFESAFGNSDVFDAYESIAMILASKHNNIFMALARKNDQLTTYDDSKVSLGRMNSISKSYELVDFTTPEAAELIDKINRSAARPVKTEMLSYVYEFAQGFPWLIKRTMAHIAHLNKSGVSQKDLVAAGLKLEDLFDEELEGLDELEREYLVRIASRLPADFSHLQRQFDEDPLLTKVLDKLTQARLLRLTGTTYDTYNDVFKEYLVYRKLPEFRQTPIFRMYAQRVLSVFHDIVQLKSITVDRLEKSQNISRGSVYNIIKELRNMNLIRKDGEHWTVPQSVQDIYHQGRLGEYCRRQLADHDIVNLLISLAAKDKPLESRQLVDLLKSKFPFVEATVSTWSVYANVLIGWVTLTRLLEESPNGHLVTPLDDRGKILQDLGNLSNLPARARANTTVFMPSITISLARTVLKKILEDVSVFDREEKKALGDLRAGGWLSGNMVSVTSVSEFDEQARNLLERPEYQSIWDSARHGRPLLEALQNQIGMSYSKGTLIWRIKHLLNWGKDLGLIPQKRYHYR